MTNPQRYGASAAPCDTGIFVMHADYEKLLAERNAALLDAERAREERNRIGVEIRNEWMAKCERLLVDAERWQTEMNLRNDPTVAIMFAGTHNRCAIYRDGELYASGETYADAINAACAKAKS